MHAGAHREHVVLFAGQSSYGVLSHLTTDLARAFVASGASAEIIDLTRLSFATELRRLQREQRVTLFCGYSGYGADLRVNNALVFDAVQRPYVGLMLDNPCYYPMRHVRASDRVLLLHGDDGHHDVSVELSPRGSVRGVFRLAASAWQRPIPPLTARATPALFASKGGNPVRYECGLSQRYSGQSLRFIRTVADALGSRAEPQRVWDVARAVAHGTTSGADFEQVERYCALVAHADHLARLRRATAVARALCALPVTFVGGDWSHLSIASVAATFLPPAPLPVVRRLMADSTIVLNVQPGTTHSMHDRFVLGLHAGAAVVSDTNLVIDATVGADAFVRWNGDPGSIADRVADTLRNRGAMQPVADCGLRVARARLTLQGVVSSVLGAAALCHAQVHTGTVPIGALCSAPAARMA
jgi:hypothetical protein